MSLFNRDNKKLDFWVLTKKDDPDRFLSITLSKAEAIEYAHTMLKFAHKPHFQAWCALRDYDWTTPNAWERYFVECIDNEEKAEYVITNITYKLKDIAAIMRMFGGCSPIGCSFETPIEYDHAKAKKELVECQKEFESFWREKHGIK